MRYDIDRRDVLKGLGAAGITGLAGCIGDAGPGNGSDDGPDVINVIGYPESAVQLFRDYYSETDGGSHDIIVPDGLLDGALPNEVGREMGNVTGTAPAAGGPNKDAFGSLFEDEYGQSPGVFTAHSYDAVAILILANAAAGENDGAAIRDQMRRMANPEGQEYGPENFVEAVEAAANGDDINYQGASSSVDFDGNGDPADATYDVWEFDGNGGTKTVNTVDYPGEGSGDVADSSPGGTDRTIRVGILLPETGDLGSVGGPMVDAAQLPIKQVNDADIGIDVETQIEDSQTQKERSISAANQLVNAGFPAIVGPASSGNFIPVAEDVLSSQGIAGCSPSSTALTIADLQDDDYVFRTAPSDQLQAEVMAQVAAKDLGAQTAATLYVNNDYGQQLSEEFAAAFKENHDGEVLNQVAFNMNESSYTSVINQATQ